MAEQIIRDPVHDVIAFADTPIDQLLFRLLDAAEFQRLRRIRQLGLTSLAYPGADHSRYSHSLGVMETARKMLSRLCAFRKVDEAEETVLLCAALLHDLGHGPFSHVFERVSGIHHEKLTQRLIADPDSEVHQVLAADEPQLPKLVVDFLRCEPGRTFLNDIVSSQLDADRFDYLLRDNHMTGSRYGDFDLNWLLHALTIDPTGTRVVVLWKGVSAAESYIQSRYHMYRNVYFHKTVRSAEGMVKLALQRAKRMAVQDRLTWPQRDMSVYKALLGLRLTNEEFADLDDVSVLHCFKLWAASDDPVLAQLCHGLLFRHLYKTIELSDMSPEQAAERFKAATEAIDAAGGDANYDMFYDEPANTPYEVFDLPEQCAGSQAIVVLKLDGKLVDLSEVSPVPAALNRTLMFRRLHVAPNWRHLV
jgi:hypothetical protein